MSKKLKPGADARVNPTGRKIYGRSSGGMVYNEHVGVMVTIKKDQSIKRNLEKRNK
jgi:hypothetical protein